LRRRRQMVISDSNSAVAKATIVNCHLPGPRLAITIRVSVDYASDPDRVEAVLVEETQRAVGQVSGLLGDPLPTARLIPGFVETGLEFSLICHVASYMDQYPVQHELRKRILRRFRAEDIAISLAARAIHLRPEDGRRA